MEKDSTTRRVMIQPINGITSQWSNTSNYETVFQIPPYCIDWTDSYIRGKPSLRVTALANLHFSTYKNMMMIPFTQINLSSNDSSTPNMFGTQNQIFLLSKGMQYLIEKKQLPKNQLKNIAFTDGLAGNSTLPGPIIDAGPLQNGISQTNTGFQAKYGTDTNAITITAINGEPFMSTLKVPYGALDTESCMLVKTYEEVKNDAGANGSCVFNEQMVKFSDLKYSVFSQQQMKGEKGFNMGALKMAIINGLSKDYIRGLAGANIDSSIVTWANATTSSASFDATIGLDLKVKNIQNVPKSLSPGVNPLLFSIYKEQLVTSIGNNAISMVFNISQSEIKKIAHMFVSVAGNVDQKYVTCGDNEAKTNGIKSYNYQLDDKVFDLGDISFQRAYEIAKKTYPYAPATNSFTDFCLNNMLPLYAIMNEDEKAYEVKQTGSTLAVNITLNAALAANCYLHLYVYGEKDFVL